MTISFKNMLFLYAEAACSKFGVLLCSFMLDCFLKNAEVSIRNLCLYSVSQCSIQLQFFKIIRCLVEHLVLVNSVECNCNNDISENPVSNAYSFLLLIKLSKKF